DNSAVRVDAQSAGAKLSDEDVDADAVRSDVPCDHEVPRALAAVGLPQPTEGPPIDVDVENRVDSVLERRPGDGDASVRPGAVLDGPFSERMVRCPHADDDVPQCP